MCDIFLFNSLLNAIDFNKTKLLLIGDNAQLPSIGAGNVIYDLIKSGCVPINSLNTVFRIDNGGILTAATKARSSTPFLKASHSPQIIGNDESYIFIPSSESDTLQKLKTLYKKLLRCGYLPKDILILSAYNKDNLGTNIINNLIQPIANKNCEQRNKCITLNFKGNKPRFYEGDLVIQTRNNYKAKTAYTHLQDCQNTVFIPNGEIGIIKSIEGSIMVIDFDENTVAYNRLDLNHINLAYSISIHKSQGGCAKVVLLVTPKSHTFMLNSNLLYVAITRAYQKVFNF